MPDKSPTAKQNHNQHIPKWIIWWLMFDPRPMKRWKAERSKEDEDVTHNFIEDPPSMSLAYWCLCLQTYWNASQNTYGLYNKRIKLQTQQALNLQC